MEVAKYFMSFLETDFKKRRLPKRNTVQKSKNGLQVAIDLDKYESLKKVINSQLIKGFPKDEIKIKKGSYTTSIPQSLLTLIEKRIKKIKKQDLEEAFIEIEKEVEEFSILYKKEHDKFLEESQEALKKILSRKFIVPFLDDLDKPLENLELANDNSKYQMEVDIIDSLLATFETSFLDLLQTYTDHDASFSFKNELEKIIILEEVKSKLIDFFESFAVSDVFYDLYQLFRNNKLLDKTELYFYFYELSLGNEKFPLLYLPLSVEKETTGFKISIDNRIFINTKAIDFVVQEYNLQVKGKSTLTGEFERIIYLNNGVDFKTQLNSILKKIEDFFELNRNIDSETPDLQKGVNLIVSFSNKYYFYLFDTSDESLINDYEEIINNGDLLEKFNELLTSFVEENPKAVIEEVNDEWDSKDIPQKLVFESPITLNDEQKQVLMALQKPDCKYLVLEGPPGTGKSHTITALICKALLEEKSVLVLSDKKEALDVVEEKISDTLNKIRHDEDFQNPILRLGRSGNKFYKIVQGQTIQKIKQHYRAYKNKKDTYDNARKKVSENLVSTIKDNIEYFENISIDDIKYFFSREDTWDNVEFISASDNLKDLKNRFLELKRSLDIIGKYKDLNTKVEWLKEFSLDDIKNYLSLLSDLNKIKESNSKIDKSVIQTILKFSDDEKEELREKIDLLSEATTVIQSTDNIIHHKYLSQVINEKSISEINQQLLNHLNTIKIYPSIKRALPSYIDQNLLKEFEIPKEVDIEVAVAALNEYIEKLNQAKKPLIGFMFKKDEVLKLTRKFKQSFHYFNLDNPEKNLNLISDVKDLYDILLHKVYSDVESQIDPKHVFNLLVSDDEDVIRLIDESKKIIDLSEFFIEQFEQKNLGYYLALQPYIELIDAFDEIRNLESEVKLGERINISLTENSLLFNETDNIKKSLESFVEDFEKSLEISSHIALIEDFQAQYEQVSKNIKLKFEDRKICNVNSELDKYSLKQLEDYLKFVEIKRHLEDQFSVQDDDEYSSNVTTLEDLVTAQMTYFLDKRIIDYSTNNAGEVGTLKNIIKRKQKFPKELFKNLKKAFPCILAGIRDYAEYIPLEKDLFDLIIIDEASQVSIAQSLPALIRGKQILVLGDDKQFSNVKANNASKVTNQELKNKVRESFRLEKLDDGDSYGWMTKVEENFDIKNSVLKFMRFIRNYESQLKKHFRCYPEIISYSDKYFYGDSLQCMKVRGVSIEDVIKFDVIDHDGKLDQSRNTNELEVQFIIDKLKGFHKKEIRQTIGVITPHREQVTLLFDKINELEERDWLFGQCKLKIMTFDTCQGEERDYIFYSMVATKEKDQLNWIFPVDFSKIADEAEGTVKSQRLNVGFSRAKNTIHFVLSKKPEEFKGEIRNALLHYQNELSISKNINAGKTDPNSPMEDLVLHYFHQTTFYKKNKGQIELKPQFPLGEYLKQLDPDYVHPLYKVDFLLIFNDEKIIIEYDGFKEHFGETDEEINISNYKYYMNSGDIYRQKVLEGYGYKFLRLNKFNLGKEPIKNFDQQLHEIVKKKLTIQKF